MKKKANRSKCYMCDNISTSNEHAPAQSFFPNGMKNNLITVPSCQTHNEDTSVDDEYVRNVITMSIENNQTSIEHFFNKTLRSFERNPKQTSDYHTKVNFPPFHSLKKVSYNNINVDTFQINRIRFDRIIRKIAYALFYKEYGYTWERLLAVTTNQFKMADMTNDHLGEIFENLSDDLNELELKGENPLVFNYAFIDMVGGEYDKALFMMFYEGFPFLIIPDNDSNHCSFD